MNSVITKKLSKQYKKGILFGVFDCFHDGHADFIRQAAKRASSVVAVVARDEAVHELKNKYPAEPAEVRLKKVKSHAGITDAVLGDRERGTYKIIEILAPDVIFLGYDQEWLAADLDAKMQAGLLSSIPRVHLVAYKPNVYHTSILNT